MFTQGVGHFVAHDHCGFVVAQFELIQNAGVKSDLAARHAKRVDLFAAQQIDFPLPLSGAVIPLCGLRHQLGGNALQALQLRVASRGQRAFCTGVGQQLAVLLAGRVFKIFSRHQLAQARRRPHVNLCQSRRNRRCHGSRAGSQ